MIRQAHHKLIVLGSSADKGFPHRRGKEKRTRSSIALENKGKFIIIDAGPDFYRQIKREKIDLKKISAIVITHPHFDHTKGLYLKRLNIPVYCGLWDELNRAKVPPEFRYLYHEGEGVEVLDITITPLRVYHSPRYETYGLLLMTKGNMEHKSKTINHKSIFYSPDLEGFPKSTAKIISKCDVLILDGSILDRDLNVHASIKSQLEWAKDWPVKKIYFTHIGRNTARRSHEELVKYLKSLDRRVDVFYDGMEIKI